MARKLEAATPGDIGITNLGCCEDISAAVTEERRRAADGQEK